MTNKQTVKFGDICREVKLTTKDPIADGYERYIGLEHLDSGSLKIKRWGMITEDNPSFTRVFKRGHILFGKRRPYLKKAAIAEFDGICSGDIIVLEASEALSTPDLLPFIIQSNAFWQHAVSTSSGSLSPRTKFSALKAFSFNLPRTQKQESLKRIFQLSLNTIQCNQIALNSLDNLKNSFSDRFKSAKNCVELSELLEFTTSGSRGWAKYYNDTEGALFIRITNMDRKSLKVDLSDKQFVKLPTGSSEGVRTKLRSGDILVSITADLGIISFIDPDFNYDGYINQHIALCRPNKGKVNPRYLAYLLASKYGQKRIASLNDGGAKAGISLRNLQTLKINIHDDQKQNEIVNILQQIDFNVECLKDSLSDIDKVFKTALDRCF